MGALLMVGALVATVVSFANAQNCHEPDCDDVAVTDAIHRAFVLLPAAVLVGAAGVALINDTYRKV